MLEKRPLSQKRSPVGEIPIFSNRSTYKFLYARRAPSVNLTVATSLPREAHKQKFIEFKSIYKNPISVENF